MVKVYIASIKVLENEEIFKVELQSVSEERRKKVNNCKLHKDKERSLLAGMLLEHAWKEYCALQYGKSEELLISYGENGKPMCVNRPNFFFNLSHSGDYVVCAVADQSIGIDIQQIKQSCLNVAKRFFTEEEWNKIEQKQTEEQADCFCKLWAMKESYIKYTGLGMQQGLNTFFSDADTGIVLDKDRKISGFTEVSSEIEGYYIAICCKEKNMKIVYENVQFLHENA